MEPQLNSSCHQIKTPVLRMVYVSLGFGQRRLMGRPLASAKAVICWTTPTQLIERGENKLVPPKSLHLAD